MVEVGPQGFGRGQCRTLRWMMADSRDHPVVIGIVGDSAAGKTTLAAGLTRALGEDRAVNICIDDYHKYSRRQRAEIGISPHNPDCNYMDILEQHVALLREGQPILKPIYNHNGGVLEAPEYVVPKDYIILEGLLGYATPRLRDAYDVKFYLEPQEDLRLRWKFQRDTGPSHYAREQVMASLPMLQRDSEQFVIPQRQYADMVVSFYPPDDRPDESGEGLSVRHILRPTLPYMDLTPVLDRGAEKGFVLELARDIDGRPVDVLDVRPGTDAQGAADMESYLWSVIPGAPAERPEIGVFEGHTDTRHRSWSLAMSQLLIAHYLVNAALAPHGS